MTYTQVQADDSIETTNGEKYPPVATLADEYGGRAQIILDDGCYVVCLRRAGNVYAPTSWIFREAWEVLVKLDPPSKELEWVLADRRAQLAKLLPP